MAVLLLPAFAAKKAEMPVKEFDINTLIYIEDHNEVDLGFDTANYLPEGFNPYEGELSVDAINFIEDDEVDLGFDTTDYLPEGFDPYK